jgi:CRP-like cAMP-binding protein
MTPEHSSGIDLLIRKLERFAPLREDMRRALRNLPLRHQEFDRGQVIATEGTIYEESALVVTGMVVRYKVLADGLRQIVAVQVPGDFTDLHSLVLKPLDHSIAAVAPSRIARVAHSAIIQLLRSHPDLSRWLMWDMAMDGAISREWATALGRCTAHQRIAHLFCELYFRLKLAGQISGDSFDLPFNQAELGDACGLSTVHVNRSLQGLRRGGLITLENHRLTIPAIEALMQAGVFDPTYLRCQEDSLVMQA